MDPVLLLPEELWAHILDKVQDFEDLLNASYTCRLWKSLLYNKRSTWMFTGAFPGLFNFLPKKDILNARLVCKRWNKGIEKYLEEGQPSILRVGGNGWRAEHCHPPRHLGVDFFRCPAAVGVGIFPHQALALFLTQFGVDWRKNPFLSRSIRLMAREELDLKLVLNILQLHGHHVWKLSVKIFADPCITPADMAKFLWKLLRSAPNLKKLELHVTVCGFHLWEKEEILALETFLKENPVPPPLTHLIYMELFTNVKAIKDKMLDAYTQQLTMYSEFGNPQYKYSSESLSNVRNMAWVFEHSNDPSVLKLRSLNCPSLNQLWISFKSFSTWARPSAADLFTAIENFRGSLKCLIITWGSFSNEKIPDRLNLPHLQEISLKYVVGDLKEFSLLFLGSLKKLKKVKLIIYKNDHLQRYQTEKHSRDPCDYVFTKKRKRKADLQYYLDDREKAVGNKDGGPYKSNVWRLMPSLSVIAVTIYSNYSGTWEDKYSKVYTRKEFQSKHSS